MAAEAIRNWRGVREETGMEARGHRGWAIKTYLIIMVGLLLRASH